MWYVYIIRSQSEPNQRYIGHSEDWQARLSSHNAGQSPHSSKFRPWKIETIVGFTEKAKAIAFERYLKSGSGFAFAKKHF